MQALGQWLLDVGEDFLSDLWDLLDPFNTDQRIPDWLRDLFDNPPISPLVLDLDEDGIDLVTLDESSAYFDLDVDGFAEKTAWIAADDAFLAYDRNGNGVIDDRSELFGGETEDGFTALAREDSNGDGIIDAADPVFASLLLWRDADGDGVTDPGELQSLADAGIVSIDLDAAFIDRWIGGNWFSHESTYTLVDGTSASVVDVWFENDQLLTLYTGGGASTLDPAAARLPDLAGYGTVPDLSIALSQQPALAQAIRDLVLSASSSTVEQMRDGFEAVFLAWTGADGADPDGRGFFIDGRHLAALEALHGRSYIAFDGTTTPGNRAGSMLEAYYDEVMQGMFARFMAQVPYSHALLLLEGGASAELALDLPFASVRYLDYDVRSDSLTADYGSIVPVIIDALLGTADDEDVAALDIGANLAQLGAILGSGSELLELQLANEIRAAADAVGLGAVIEMLIPNLVTGRMVATTSGDDVVVGGSASDVLAGGLGDDVLRGDDGSDNYVWSHGDGADVVEDGLYDGRTDRLILADVAAGSVSLSRDGNDLIVTIAESAPAAGDGGSVRLVDSIDDDRETGVEQIVLGDGEVWDRQRFRVELVSASEGDDLLYGGEAGESFDGLGGNDQIFAAGGNDDLNGGTGDDLLDGGAGDDVLAGGEGADTLVFRLGDGQDQVWGFDPSVDRIALDGLAPQDIRFEDFGGASQITGADGTHFYFHGLTGILRSDIVFVSAADGSVLDASAPREIVGGTGDDVLVGGAEPNTLLGGAGNDTLNGIAGANTLDGGAGNDTLIAGSGADTLVLRLGGGQDEGWAFDPTTDRIALDGLTPDQVTFADFGNASQITAADGSFVYFHGLTGFAKEDLVFVDLATGAVLPVGATAIDGTAGDDSLVGTGANEIISGRAGADFLWSNGGTDTLDGGTGDDFLRAGSGADTIVFRSGDGADVVELFDLASDRIDLVDVDEADLAFWEDTTGTLISAPDGTSLWLIGITGVQPGGFAFV
ncbi:calcium-binding protein [Salinarimonas ramus]|uniref:Ca2+-binding protein, RTX toxin-related n=1 Tax=Salinarimonas ramus TaxID=690164 RepID=A0A917V250_9HYPH|nr:calcium-binding protein [Salinarimonas ramus]GGK25134.1 hypothetical protein GCM10011322_09620 [Salinarimonas ramus]